MSQDAFDIEQPGILLAYLRRQGHLDACDNARVQVLAGGVSNRAVLVEPENKKGFVVKQALEKLRVATDWHSDPMRIHREAAGLRWLAQLAPPQTITPLLFEDKELHLLAMEAVPSPHDNWKTLLLSGQIVLEHVAQFASLIGTIHRRAHELRHVVEPLSEERRFFEELRLTPYYRYVALRHPQSAAFFDNLVSETLATRQTLVHGDYSPKNVLVFEERLILLDHEVIHWGDGAFDIGFSLTHLLSKAHHMVERRDDLRAAALHYWATYREMAGSLVDETFAARSVRHTVACLLARVDGRSPLEYLSDAQRERQRRVALMLMSHAPSDIPDLIEAFVENVS